MQKLKKTFSVRPEVALEEREPRVVRSALWAAAGDALGWITELSHGAMNVKRRSGSAFVEKPVDWTRLVGGRSGPKVRLPAGTYSDDTQLRLAVSRCIRGNGEFDAEAFAKVELTVWPTYALGAGLGTKAAAASLGRRSTSWFSNFFESGEQRYIQGGGNGAAMRVQPHVWAANGSEADLILSVMRDALITHGHPQGFCGAVFHALALHATICSGDIPAPETWFSFVDTFLDIPKILDRDPQLSTFWRSVWEEKSEVTLDFALKQAHADAVYDLERVLVACGSMEPGEYTYVLETLGCTTPKFRGAGLKTAMAAGALAFMYRDGSPELALAQAANELESDTDTIATMAGALLGAVAKTEPSWPIQDREYIVQEAERLVDVSAGRLRDSFSYPDLARWIPPANQLAAVGMIEDDLALMGLGFLVPKEPEYRIGGYLWQWCRLPFGQTILAKRKVKLDKVSLTMMPGASIPNSDNPTPAITEHRRSQQSLEFAESSVDVPGSASEEAISDSPWSLDFATDEAIKADFDPAVVGRLLNECIDQSDSIELAIAFAAIVAKAKLARRRRRR